MSFSYLSHLSCSRCGRTFSAENGMLTCPWCGSPLLAQYDLSAVRRSLTKSELSARPQALWRYHELLPVRDERHIVTLGESFTPIVPLLASGRDMGLSHLLAKDEGMLPSGTFKARGATVGISRAKELGVTKLALPTNGNAGAAWALYAARAGIQATVVMPKSAPAVPRKECVAAGAKLFVIDGTIGDAGRTVGRAAARHNWYDVSTLREPYRLEGKKTMGMEIAEQFGWSVPDVIVYPTGGGAGVIGIYKGLLELRELGWIGDKLPKMAIVQSGGCAPLVRAFEQGKDVSETWPNPHTIAFGMRVPKALGDFLILDVIRKTGGIAIEVAEEEIVQERAGTVRRDGLHVCPEGAAALAGARKLRGMGWLQGDETVLVMNTGSGLKYVEQVAGTGEPLGLEDELPEM